MWNVDVADKHVDSDASEEETWRDIRVNSG